MRCACYRSAYARSPAFPARKKKPCRAERRPRCRRVGRRQRSCRQPMDCSPAEEERSAQSKRERNRCYGDNQIHANPQSGGRRSHGVTCLWPLAPKRGQSWPRWQPSRRGRGLYRIGAPRRCCRRCDGAKHSERLPPPVRGSTRCVKEQGSVITVACRGKRKSQHCCQPCSWRTTSSILPGFEFSTGTGP